VLVDTRVLPEVILRTLQANRLLQSGEVKSVSAAVKAVGLSRTAYYKYRHAVLPYHAETAGRTITVQLVLRQSPGAISRVLDAFTRAGANILTVNQSIPVGGLARASVSARIDRLSMPLREFLSSLKAVDGVERVEGIVDG
jgi:chorismate mutase